MSIDGEKREQADVMRLGEEIADASVERTRFAKLGDALAFPFCPPTLPCSKQAYRCKKDVPASKGQGIRLKRQWQEVTDGNSNARTSQHADPRCSS